MIIFQLVTKEDPGNEKKVILLQPLKTFTVR